jgi:preprotein translocase subunit YajC
VNLSEVSPGTRVVTSSGDVVEVLRVNPDGVSAQVRYAETVAMSAGTQGEEIMMSSDDIMTIATDRFVGPT